MGPALYGCAVCKTVCKREPNLHCTTSTVERIAVRFSARAAQSETTAATVNREREARHEPDRGRAGGPFTCTCRTMAAGVGRWRRRRPGHPRAHVVGPDRL